MTLHFSYKNDISCFDIDAHVLEIEAWIFMLAAVRHRDEQKTEH